MNHIVTNVPLPTFYIAGPMTGYPEFNFPKFDEAAAYLETLRYGYINPADIDRQQGFDEKGLTGNEPLSDAQRQQFARNDLGSLLQVTAILLLPGWQESTGASNEAMVASWLGLRAYEYNDGKYIAQRLRPVHLTDRFSSVNMPATTVKREPETFTNEVGDTFVEYLVSDERNEIFEAAAFVGSKAQKANDQRLGETRVVNNVTGGEKGTKLARFDLLPVRSLTAAAEQFGRGAFKYEDRNWERGYEWSLSYAALMRHLTAWWGREDNDPEFGTSHLDAVLFHAMAMREFIATHPEMDDRPQQNGTTS